MSSFHTLAHKEKDRLRDERVGRIVLAHLNLTFNSLNVYLTWQGSWYVPCSSRESYQDFAKFAATLLNRLRLG